MADLSFDELSLVLRYALSAGAPSGPVATPATASAAKTESKPADDFDDMFGDEEEETEEERAANKARQERMALAKKLKEEKDAKEGKKQKEKPVEKSLIVLEVKPWEADTDLEAVWREIIKYERRERHGDKDKLNKVVNECEKTTTWIHRHRI